MAHFFQKHKGTGELMYIGEQDAGGFGVWQEAFIPPTSFATVAQAPMSAITTGVSISYVRTAEDVYIATVDEFIEHRMGSGTPT